MVYQNLKFLQDSLLNTQRICSWNFTLDMQLLFSNCIEQDFFSNLFMVSSCSKEISSHFKISEAPIITTDSIGFVWIAAYQNILSSAQTPTIHILGPIFTSSMTEKYMSSHIKQLHLSADLVSRLWNFIKDVPSISYDMAAAFGSMLNSCVNLNNVLPSDIEILREVSNIENDIDWGSREWHGDWAAEKQFLKSISEGRIVDLNKITTGKIGNIGGGDPLRQAKNGLIVLAVLCSRAAIDGGVSPEGSLTLSDFFIQAAESATSISSVEAIGSEMYLTYINRVQLARKNSCYSPLVQACAEYVQTNIFMRINLSDISSSVGYAEHYISHIFKKEMGISLSNYINQQKIEMAKNLLKNSTISISELAAQLGYTSPSYFCSIFKKCTNMSPTEYQLQ